MQGALGGMETTFKPLASFMWALRAFVSARIHVTSKWPMFKPAIPRLHDRIAWAGGMARAQSVIEERCRRYGRSNWSASKTTA
ncbi:hypothetical protein BD626DRAFT_62675 [Schizophyllum amplum]|uniref:Uncharacterized protein n=1 Tax=Schizophyllum amplum TaxID=97359 RepID=A0A550BSF4_9AGAR|nr:hypothetical protein BD626DRAFT_62675 [Auriculariopsis ampla]